MSMSSALQSVPRISAIYALPGCSEWRPWWGVGMDDEAYRRLLVDIEAAKGKQSAHEAVCAERYARINERFGSFEEKLDEVIARAEKSKDSTGKWTFWSLTTLVVVLIGAIGWSYGQLFALEPMRAAAHIAKK